MSPKRSPVFFAMVRAVLPLLLPEGSTPRNSHVITQVERKWWVSFAGDSRAPGTSPVSARAQEDTHRNFQRDVRLADAEQADDACHIGRRDVVERALVFLLELLAQVVGGNIARFAIAEVAAG